MDLRLWLRRTPGRLRNGVADNRHLDFFFDFLSPFAYLAHGEVMELCERHDLELRYLPIDLAAAKAAAGNTGPPNRDIPVKLRYLLRDIERWAEHYGGLPVKFPKSLESRRMNIGTFYAVARGQAPAYVTAGFHAGWGLGGDLNDDSVLRALAREMGWDDDDFLAFLAAPSGQAAYEASNAEARSRGVFGVPTMMVADEMWWGNDRLFFIEAFLGRHSATGA